MYISHENQLPIQIDFQIQIYPNINIHICTHMLFTTHDLKGKLGEFFLSAQSFYRPQTKRSLNTHFSQKSPEAGQKSVQRVKNSRNKNQSANSGQQLL